MIGIMAFLFAIGLGFGLSCWIFGTILDKSNNIGDSHGKSIDYRAYVTFTARKDRMSNAERDSFSARYAERIDSPSAGPSGSELVRRLTDEEIEKYNSPKQNDEVKPVVQQTTGIVDNESEFEAWEKKAYPDSSPFKRNT